MLDTNRLMYIHGSESDSNSGKARQFRGWFPGMVTPDFKGAFDERMSQLYSILSNLSVISHRSYSPILPSASWKMIIACIKPPMNWIGIPYLPKPGD